MKKILRNLVCIIAVTLGVAAVAADANKKSKKPDAAEKYAQQMEKEYQKSFRGFGKTAEEILSQVGKAKSAKVLDALQFRLWMKTELKGPDALSETERRISAVVELAASVKDEGFGDYFIGDAAGQAPLALAFLKELGATATAAVVQKALAPFEKGTPPADYGKRQEALDKIEKTAMPIWAKCDKEFRALKEDFPKLLLEYAAKKKEDIRLP
jgi:hypothetical protein